MDKFTRTVRSKIMSKIRSKHTQPEIALRKALWTKGLRYRLHYGPEKVDIAFPSKKLAIFVDGCFWHSCPIHGHKPKTNKAYWLPKLKKNRLRDNAATKRLNGDGWKVIRIWEHDIRLG